MKPTRELFQLGQAVFLEGIEKLKECKKLDFIHNRDGMIIKKRLAVTEMTHGIELILKAVLIKKGYRIYKFKQRIVKETHPLDSLIDIDKTFELSEVITFFKNEYRNISFEEINQLRKLRNQIIHRGTKIDEKKKAYFIGAIDCLTNLYNREGIKNRKFLRKIESAKKEI